MLLTRAMATNSEEATSSVEAGLLLSLRGEASSDPPSAESTTLASTPSNASTASTSPTNSASGTSSLSLSSSPSSGSSATQNHDNTPARDGSSDDGSPPDSRGGGQPGKRKRRGQMKLPLANKRARYSKGKVCCLDSILFVSLLPQYLILTVLILFLFLVVTATRRQQFRQRG